MNFKKNVMKRKENDNLVRRIIFLFILLTANIYGFSQGDIPIGLDPQKEVEKTITLSPLVGTGKPVNLLVSLNWDKEKKLIKVDFKGDNTQEKFIYSFPTLMFYKNVMKTKTNTWFDKGMKNKYMTERLVVRSIDVDALVNVKLESANNEIKVLEFKDSQSKLTFNFREQIAKKEDICKIPVTLYVASRENKKCSPQRNRKIEYQAKFTLIISLQDICDDPKLKELVGWLNRKTEDMYTRNEEIKEDLNLLYNLSCTQIKLKEREKEEEEITDIKDQQYQQYVACENLIAAKKTHNEILKDLNKTIRRYNSSLSDRKQACSSRPVEVEPVKCEQLNKINGKLYDLCLDIRYKRINKGDGNRKYEEITESIDISDYKKCKEDLNAFNMYCNEIKKLLK